MKLFLKALLLFLVSSSSFAQNYEVRVVSNAEGDMLMVNGKEFMINGMNWDYIPIGTNTINADFWNKSDDVVRAGLDSEMSLLKSMGVNVIRQYIGIPSKWIRYIYENYGIYTLLNHSFGRYGLTLDGAWVPVTDYADPKTQEFLLDEVENLAKEYQNTPGLLMYLLGNENNYGLFWAGAETEDFPEDEDRIQYIGETRGRPMYRLMNEAAKRMKTIDPSHPVAICNGDVLFIDIVAEECADVDVYGANTYRGVSFGDMFQTVKDKLNKPLMFTEFGADAFNAIENREDQLSQAYYMLGNWKEIYQNAAGLGKVGNSIGGFTFQFSDGWWKFGFNDRKNADVHDNNASWSNGGYLRDLAGPGKNNMNEEWFGICAKGPTNEKGLYKLYPRAAYYALKDAHQLDPYADGMTLEFLDKHFDDIELMDALMRAKGDKGAPQFEESKLLRGGNLKAKFSTFKSTGGMITNPDGPDPETAVFQDQLEFDHTQSFSLGFEGTPVPNMRANVNFNIQERIGSGTVSAGDTVKVHFDHKGSVVEHGVSVNVILLGEGASGVSFSQVLAPGPALSDSWTSYTGTYTIPGGTDVSEGISVLIETVCGAGTVCSMTMDIDNVSVTFNP